MSKKLVEFTFNNKPEDIWAHAQHDSIKAVEHYIKTSGKSVHHIVEWWAELPNSNDNNFIKYLNKNQIGYSTILNGFSTNDGCWILKYNDIIPQSHEHYDAKITGVRYKCIMQFIQTIKRYGIHSQIESDIRPR